MCNVALSVGTLMTLFNFFCFMNDNNDTVDEIDESELMLSISQYKSIYTICALFTLIILYCGFHWRQCSILIMPFVQM